MGLPCMFKSPLEKFSPTPIVAVPLEASGLPATIGSIAEGIVARFRSAVGILANDVEFWARSRLSGDTSEN